METIVHGDLQRAKLSAERLTYKVRDGGDCFQLWIMDPDEWVYVGRLTSMRFVRAILDDLLSDR